VKAVVDFGEATIAAIVVNGGIGKWSKQGAVGHRHLAMDGSS